VLAKLNHAGASRENRLEIAPLKSTRPSGIARSAGRESAREKTGLGEDRNRAGRGGEVGTLRRVARQED